MSMSTGAKVGIGTAIFFFILVFVVGLIVVSSYIGAVNRGAAFEAQIKAEWNNNKQILAAYSTKVMEAVQVPGMQADAITKIVQAANQARYGQGGSKSSFQWIKEENPQIDQKTFDHLMTLIEVGRDDFKNQQTKILDICRSYETSRNSFWSGIWLRSAGYPKDPQLNTYCTVVTNSYSADSYTTGKAEALKLH